MLDAFEEKAGLTNPEFPIILYNDGGKRLAEEVFKKPNSAGPVFLCHPKLFFEQLSNYSEATLTSAANKALNDDCLSSHISLEKDYINSENIRIYKNRLAIHVESNTQVEIRILSINGKVIHSQSKELFKGINKFSLDNQRIAKGIYMLEIKNNMAGINFISKVEFK